MLVSELKEEARTSSSPFYFKTRYLPNFTKRDHLFYLFFSEMIHFVLLFYHELVPQTFFFLFKQPIIRHAENKCLVGKCHTVDESCAKGSPCLGFCFSRERDI